MGLKKTFIAIYIEEFDKDDRFRWDGGAGYVGDVLALSQLKCCYWKETQWAETSSI